MFEMPFVRACVMSCNVSDGGELKLVKKARYTAKSHPCATRWQINRSKRTVYHCVPYTNTTCQRAASNIRQLNWTRHLNILNISIIIFICSYANKCAMPNLCKLKLDETCC